MALNVIVNLDPDDFTPMKNKKNQYIVVHYTGNKTDSAANNQKYFRNGKRYASAHYFVDEKDVFQIVQDKDASWGVGKKYADAPLWGVVKNSNSINIEMCSKDGRIPLETFNNTVELVKELMKKYSIPASNVVRHYDVCGKRCPGWDGWLPGNEYLWNDFKNKLVSAGSVKPVNPSPAKNKLSVDGIAGEATIRATQRFFGTKEDGWISGQILTNQQKYFPGIVNCLYGGKGGSSCVKALQGWLGVEDDGILGPATIKAWQTRMGTKPVDGIASKGGALIRAWQEFLNSRM